MEENEQLKAQIMILEHKLSDIRDYAKNCVYSNPDLIEMSNILYIINRYETVDKNWKLSEPLVKEVLSDEIK